jgi:hypothetical protein
MTVQTFYRLAVWLPLAIPSFVAFIAHGLGIVAIGGVPGVGLLLASLLYGGIPYAPIAIWASFWIDSRPEADIRRRALQAPLWMIVTFAVFCVALAIRGVTLVAAVAVFVLGAIVSLGLGYLYVIIVFALRDTVFGPFQSVRSESKWRW